MAQFKLSKSPLMIFSCETKQKRQITVPFSLLGKQHGKFALQQLVQWFSACGLWVLYHMVYNYAITWFKVSC